MEAKIEKFSQTELETVRLTNQGNFSIERTGVFSSFQQDKVHASINS